MAVDFSVSGVTSGGDCSITVSGSPSGATAVQYQYCARPDFRFSPVFQFSSSGGDQSALAVTGFNQATNYFMRARAIKSDGTPDAWSSVIGVWFPLFAAQSTAPAAVLIMPALIVPCMPVIAWTASNEQAGYPVRALARDDPNSMWQGLMASSAISFEMQIGGAPIDTIALLETNGTEGMTVTVKGGASLANVRGGSPSYTLSSRPFRASANVPGRTTFHGVFRLPAPQAYPFWRVELSGDVPGAIFAATYAAIGLGIQAKNYTVGKTESLQDLGTMDRTREGNADRALGHKMRRVDMDVSYLTETQHETLFAALPGIIGQTEPALVIPNTRAGPFLHNRILFGVISGQKTSAPSALHFTDSISVDSLI